MRVLYTTAKRVAYDITELVEEATWGGDYQKAARTLNLSVLGDARAGAAGKVTEQIELGEMIQLFSGTDDLFQGFIFSHNAELGSAVRKVVAYDAAIYLLKSSIARNFMGVTARAVTQTVAAAFGIRVGTMPSDAGLSMNFAHLNKPAYAAIQGAWTKVSAVTGYKYQIRMERGLLTVVIAGKAYAPFVLDSGVNLVDGSVSDSIEDAVTQAIVTGKKGNAVAVLTDSKNLKAYGLLQATAAQEEKKNPTLQARKMLKGPEQQISLHRVIGGPGAEKLITGNAAAVEDRALGLAGRYFIINDEHTFSGGRHFVSLGLSFDALMDEQELEEVKAASKKKTKPKTDDDTPSGDIWKTAAEYGAADTATTP